jgi:hypothetical protein
LERLAQLKPQIDQKGDRIDILPQWQDPGDGNYVWVAIDDEENGKVTISPISMDVAIKPCTTVFSNDVVLREAGFVASVLKGQGLA